MTFAVEHFIARFFKFLQDRGTTFNAVTGVLCAMLLGVLDMLTPAEYNFSFLYLLPISFTTWFGGKRAGIGVALICAGFWSRFYLTEGSPAAVWNIFSTLGIFFVVACMLCRLRKLIEAESVLSRLDPLTGVMNLRAFSELVEYEILRLAREGSPFSLAFLDLDDFKQVNDRYGHRQGDELLKAVVNCLSLSLRRTDAVARLGGDEFAIFFPSTDQEAVRMVTQKVREELDRLSRERSLPSTVSMGVVTCPSGTCSLEDIIATADRLMYEVKLSGKNNVRYGEQFGTTREACPQPPGSREEKFSRRPGLIST